MTFCVSLFCHCSHNVVKDVSSGFQGRCHNIITCVTTVNVTVDNRVGTNQEELPHTMSQYTVIGVISFL